MTELQFKRAVKKGLFAHIAILGPSGSGKTYTGLRWAYALASTGKVAALDTEHGSLSKYAGEKVDGHEWRPDVITLESFSPELYIEGIKLAEKLGYEVLIIDSLSHAWAGKDGVLEFVDQVARKSQSGNSFAAWRQGTPLQNQLVETMLAAKLHLIITLRVKSEYVIEKDERTGKSAPKKIGLQPVQREGIEYEFDLVCDMQEGNSLSVSKSRCSALNGKFYDKPGAEPMVILNKWLTGEAETTQPQATTTPQPGTTTAPAKPHWIEDDKTRAAFWAHWKQKSLSDADVHAALGVEHVNLFTGTKEDAFAKINDWIKAKAQPQS